MKKTKKGFTLIELLMVIAIIAIIGAGSVALTKIGTGRQSLVAAQQTMMSAFENARLLSISKNARARVIIYKGKDVSRKLRQVGIVYEAYDENGQNMGWIASDMPTMLPKGTFYMPPSGEYRSNITLAPDVREADIICSTFRSAVTGAPNVVSLDEFSRTPRSMGESNGDWYCYEFSPEGMSENPSAAIILAKGNVRGDGTIFYENPYQIMGFVVLRSGRVVGFSDYAEIEGNLKEK